MLIFVRTGTPAASKRVTSLSNAFGIPVPGWTSRRKASRATVKGSGQRRCASSIVKRRPSTITVSGKRSRNHTIPRDSRPLAFSFTVTYAPAESASASFSRSSGRSARPSTTGTCTASAPAGTTLQFGRTW